MTMNTNFGLGGTIQPASAFKDRSESFTIDNFQIQITGALLEIGFENDDESENARLVVDQLLGGLSMDNNLRFTIDLNQAWKTEPEGGRALSITISETVNVSDRIVTTTTIIKKGLSYIVSKFDSYDLKNQVELVSKCQKDPTLALAVKYFSEEVIDQERPMYGIYKAIESLAGKVGGREKLGILAGRNKKYVDEVMETANTFRHTAGGHSRQLLTDNECHDRAKLLIDAYAKSII